MKFGLFGLCLIMFQKGIYNMQIFNNGNVATFSEDGWLQEFNVSGCMWRFLENGPGWSIKLAGIDRPYYCNSRPVKMEQFNDHMILHYNSFVNDDMKLLKADISIEWFWEDGLLCCGIRFGRLPKDIVPDAFIWPDVTLETSEQTVLTLPEDTGGQIENLPAHLCDNPNIPNEYIFKKLCMQVVGWEDGDKGLRIETHDSEGWFRQLRITGEDSHNIHFRLEHFLPRSVDLQGFSFPYSGGLGTFTDGWYGCAAEYRKWALQQKWAQRGQDKRKNSYIGKLACWCWNRGRGDDVCPPVNELSRRIGAPVALDWYWWHKHPYDMGYPEYFPPREGEDKFSKHLDTIHQQGNYVQVYTNGMSWDMELDSWKTEGHKHNIILEDQEPFGVIYNTWTNHRLGHICGSSDGWEDIELQIATEVKKAGLDGLYLDQIATLGNSTRCFSDNHGHLPGGGCYATKGFRKILKNIRKQFPSLQLSSESTLEYFMDLLDANITLFSSFERIFLAHNPFYSIMRPIPFASAVYHGKMVMFGNYAIVDSIPPYDELWPPEGKPASDKEQNWISVVPDQFAFELARTVSFGLQPMVAKLTMEHLTKAIYQEDIDFLVRLSKFYHENRDWLLWGTLMAPCDCTCSDIDIKFACRGVFTAPEDVKLLSRTYPAVLISTWKDEQEQIKIIIINYTREPQPVSLTISEEYVYSNNNTHLINSDASCFKGTIPARSIEYIDCITADRHE